MSQLDANQEFTQYQMLTTHGDHSHFKLPSINPSRNNVKSKAEIRRKSEGLPHLPQKHASKQPIKGVISPKKNESGSRQKQQFTLQIEQRLKQIIQNVYKGQQIQQNGQSSQVDFQAAIQHNKQKIKRQKKNNNQEKQNQILRSESKPDRQNLHPKYNANKKSPKGHEDNQYDKRIKELSLENKYLLKKKEIIAQKNETIEKLKQIKKEREETVASHQANVSKDHSININQNYNQGNQVNQGNQGNQGNNGGKTPRIPLPVRYVTKSKKPAKVQSPKKEGKLQQIRSSINLFDNIHGLLENPLKHKVISYPKCSPEKILQLQHRIKVINDKLGISSTIETEQNLSVMENKTVLDWKRIQLRKGQVLKCYNDSSFEKQMNRVNMLQQKNDNSFSEYLMNQKMILQLQILQKMKRNGAERRTS